MTTTGRDADADQLRELVREGYTRVAEGSSSHGGGDAGHASEHGQRLGYSQEELQCVPEGANLGVGCGNPTALASLAAGEVVVDLGSGAGFDTFLAARAVGPTGRAIGIDMTDAMLEKARSNALAGGYENVEFRKGTIENLPLESGSVDVIISNCVINLSPEKERVFREAYRVLRPGGRVMISDVVLERPLPRELIESVEAYIGCVGGACLRSEYLAVIEASGFREVEIVKESRFADAYASDESELREAAKRFGIEPEQALEFADAVTSLQVRAVK